MSAFERLERALEQAHRLVSTAHSPSTGTATTHKLTPVAMAAIDQDRVLDSASLSSWQHEPRVELEEEEHRELSDSHEQRLLNQSISQDGDFVTQWLKSTTGCATEPLEMESVASDSPAAPVPSLDSLLQTSAALQRAVLGSPFLSPRPAAQSKAPSLVGTDITQELLLDQPPSVCAAEHNVDRGTALTKPLLRLAAVACAAVVLPIIASLASQIDANLVTGLFKGHGKPQEPVHALYEELVGDITSDIVDRGLYLRPGATATASLLLGLLATVLLPSLREHLSTMTSRKGDSTQDVAMRLTFAEYLRQGQDLYFRPQLDIAANSFQQAFHAADSSRDRAHALEWLARTQYRLAKVFGSSERMSAAAELFHKALRCDSERHTARASWGRCLYYLCDFDAAEKVLNQAIRRDSTVPFAHEYLGKTLAALGRSKEAEASLRRSSALEPTSYRSLAFLGELLHLRGQTSEAKTSLEQAVSLRDDYPAAHARLALIALEQLDREAALRHLHAYARSRTNGFADDSMASTIRSMRGNRPFVHMYLLAPVDERSAVVQSGLDALPEDDLLLLLDSIVRHDALTKTARRDTKPSVDAHDPLEARERALRRKYETSPDAHVCALHAIALAALGRQRHARLSFREFCKQLKGDAQAQSRFDDDKAGYEMYFLVFYSLM